MMGTARHEEMACHSGDDASGVDLFQGDLAGALVGVPALRNRDGVDCPEPDASELFISSEDLEASLFWEKITDTHACGDPMPLPYALARLPETDLACIHSWMEGMVAERYENLR